MKKEIALKIIEKNRKSYNEIAQDFDVSRQYAWPAFVELKKYITPNIKILDIGCGNGRLYKYINHELKVKNYQYVGVDQSGELLKIARKNYPKVRFEVADVFKMSFKDREFDVVAGIAFLHHIPSEELRLNVLREIYRLLLPDGILFLTNWNLRQFRLIKKYKLCLWDFVFKHKDLEAGDFWIDFQGVPRYYHNFTKRELIRLAKQTGFKILKYKKGKNSIVILKK